MKVRWTEQADYEREMIVGSIWKDNPLAAEKMDALFDSAVERLGEFPDLGRQGIVQGTRELIPHPSYRIVYQIGDREVVILSLIHTRRQWPPAADDA